ncbi:MAG: hypothetical protein IJK63_12080 [Oscillospiraceae bacterium]|nr:hypothetical protein [Oscillospiraceae bacterium]
MKSRKRVLSLLLALLMLVSLFPTAALAEAPEEEAPVFLVQPESGCHPQGEPYLLTWALNRTPDRLELVREEPAEDPSEILLIPVQELDPASESLELTAPETETIFHLRAFYGEEELVSEPFTVSVILSEAKDLDGDSSSAEPPQNDKEEDVPGDADEPEAAPAPADEPEGTHRLIGEVVTYKSGGAVDSLNTGASIQVSASNPSSGTNVSCEVTLNSGYRLLAVFYGPTDGTAAMDVTDSMPVRMWDQNMAFVACVIPESGIMPCEHVALSITAPSLGGSYSGTVNASVTKYFNDGNTGFSALGAYSVLSAVWKEEGGTNPTSFQVGKSYYTVITLKPTSGWGFPTDCYAQLTMPNGLKVNSGTGDVTVSRLPNGNLRIQSPLYTIPETEGWYNLYGYASTLDANGVYDSSLSGGTIRVSTGCAQAGGTVSCTVTPNSGYRVISVLYGPDGDEPIEDVSGTLQTTMQSREMSFRAYFIAEDAVAPNYGAAVSIGAPAAGGSYPNGVPVSTTNYYSFSAHVNAISAYHVENAVWTIKYGGTPTTLLAGHKYCAEFDLVANPGWRFFDTISVELTMPDGSVARSANGDFTVTRNADGSFHVKSPEVTLPGSTSYHHLMGRALTFDENGMRDDEHPGGTVSVSTGTAQEGDNVSCQVTVNPGYRLLMVQFCLDYDEPVADVTDSLQAVMRDRDMEFRAYFIKDGGSISCPAAAVQLEYPYSEGYANLPAATVTKYFSMTTWAVEPAAYSVTDAAWRDEDGQCVGFFYSGSQYYATFILTPNEGWYFEDNFAVELTMPDGSVLNSRDGDFTITRNADGSITVKTPTTTVPVTQEPGDGSMSLYFTVEVYDADYHLVPDVIGGTASFSPAHPRAGDTVTVTAEPAPGYQLQYVYYDNGVTMGYDATPEMSYVIPENYGTLAVCFTPVGTSLPLPSATQKVELPLAGTQNSGAGQVLNGEHQWYDVESVTWYGGAGSGCQGQEPASFLPGARYYAEVILTPHAHWHWRPDTNLLMLYHDPADPDPGSVNWDLPSGSTCSVDAQGRLHVVGEEILLPGAVTLRLYQYTHGDDVYAVSGTVKFSVNGGAAQTLPASNELMVLPGDQISLVVTPYAGYRLQSANLGIGETFAGDITDTLTFTVPDDCAVCDVIVYFAPADAATPINSVTVNLPLPLPAGSYSAGATEAEYGGLENYTILGTFWYGGTGSGCQNTFPSSFINGASYYARIWLVPKDNWCFAEGTQVWIRLEDGSLVEAKSTSFDAETGQFLIETYEYPIFNRDILEASVGLQMFEEGGEYPQGCPVVFDLPENAPFTVSDAIWYNYANQESGGIGLAAGFFTADGRYFTEFDLIPNEGYIFTAASQINLTNGSVEIKTLNSDGSLHVVTSWYSLNPEAAAQQRRVFVTNYVMNADGSVNSSGSGGYVLPNDGSPKVGDTLIFGVMPKNGYRLQWMTAARDSEQVGEDITDSLEFYVADEPGDVYVNAFFALADEPVTCSQVDLNVQLPAPGGNYSGLAPATVMPNVVNASKYSVVSARWYEIQEHGVGTPSSFVPGEQYCVEIILTPNPGWCFGDNPGAFLLFSDGTGMDSRFGEVSPYKQSDGNLVLTSDFITLPEVEIDSVELSLDLPELGDSFVAESKPWATFYTPHVGEMYTLWKNGADQATGAKDSVTSSFQPGCVYYATIRLIADPGYYLAADTRVTLRNGLSFTTQYLETDRSLWIHTESIAIPTEGFQLSGTYVKFRLNGEEISSARPGDYVVVRTDITTQPEGVYLANVTSEDVELTQLTDITWGFTMPAKNVSVTGELLPQETYIFELEDMTHDVNAADARWLFGEQEAGTRLEQDLDSDGYTDIFVDYYEDGTVQVIRVGNIYGDFTIQTPSGRFGTRIYRFGPERYDLYLGSVQVNAENKNNIPVLGGKASYDPATHTLHLDGYTGSIGVARQDSAYPSLTNSFSITASGDLNITGNGRLLDASLRGGIHCGGNLTLNGDFVIHAWLHGIYVEGDLTVRGNVKVHDTTQVGVGVGGDLNVTQSSLRVSTNEGIGVDSRGNVTVAGELHSEAGEAGLNCGGNVTLVGGTIWVSSTNDIGLLGSSDLNIQNGGFTAYGNVQALEVASISFDTSTHFIRLPQNGTVSSDGSTIIDPATNAPALDAQITERRPTILLGVKDLEGNEGVGGTVAIENGDYDVSVNGSFNYGTLIGVHAQADTGYRFDHWEDAYGGSPGDESGFPDMQIGVYVDNQLYAVFEELLPIQSPYFTDPNFRAYISEHFDLDHDGYLSWAERSLVTSIDVSNKSITSLVGLKYFPELVTLKCSGNPNLQEVDLRNNPMIETLDCSGNSKLSRLYVVGCSELRELRCNSCPLLTSIAFAGCGKLEILICMMCDLRSLNLSNCTGLKVLQCYNNTNLSTLAINSDELYMLLCYGTKLNTLDVSSCSLLQKAYYLGTVSHASYYDDYHYAQGSADYRIRCNPGAVVEDDLGIPINKPNFPDDDFRQYGASVFDLNKNGWLSPSEIAQADSLCIEEWADLHNVQGIHFLTELTFLMIDGNPNLTELDLSANTKLTGLEAWGNGLTTLTLGQQVNLRSIYVDGNALSTLDLSGAPNLLLLDISDNPLIEIDLSAAPDLQELYIYHTDLAELDLTDNPILLDAYLNGTPTVHENYVEYAGGPLGGRLLIDEDQTVITEKPHIPGDINGDGNVDGTDVVLLATYVKAGGSGVTIVPGSGDVNGDGRVDGTDVTLLATYVKAGGQGVPIH